jgi:citrate lyase subunit alpha/citrate CoA-transferase
LRSHGGRARAIATGELSIDVAFLAAPIADEYGNCNGMYGPSAFGAMGYAYTDALYAEYTVILTDNLQPYPVTPISVPQTFVDYIVEIDTIGNPSGIQTGTMEITKSPSRLMMARNIVKILKECKVLKNGFTFQAGAGGTSLAVTQFIHEYLKKHHISAEFVMGGTTRFIVDMLNQGTVKKILEGQSFDTKSIESLKSNPQHVEINNTFYADSSSGGCAVDKLQAAFLGATEIDLDFNVNVNTHSDGILFHGIGGHQDVAAGADITIIMAPLLRGRIPSISPHVTTITTPGETIDILVTDYGISINPQREDILGFLKSKIPVFEIEDLYKKARELSGNPKKILFDDEIVALIEYRDGTIIDVVKKVKDFQ